MDFVTPETVPVKVGLASGAYRAAAAAGVKVI
jgi:hypothetical protein